jgi:hypothetical protein
MTIYNCDKCKINYKHIKLQHIENAYKSNIYNINYDSIIQLHTQK